MKQAERLDRTLSALADPGRCRVVELLRERPHTAGERAGRIGLSPAALSRHLKTLKVPRLVVDPHPEYDARVRIHHLNPAPMAEREDWLAKTGTLCAGRLAAFEAHV